MRGWRRAGHTGLRVPRGDKGTASWRGNWEAETSQVHLPDEVGEEGRRAEGRKQDCRERKAVDWGPEVQGRRTWVVLAASSSSQLLSWVRLLASWRQPGTMF